MKLTSRNMHLVLVPAVLSILIPTTFTLSQDCHPDWIKCDCSEEEIGSRTIKTMSCSYSAFSSLSSTLSFSTLPQLPADITELQFDRITLPTIGNNSFAGLTNLQVLALDFCDIENIEILAFSQLRNLKELNLQNNRIKNLPDLIFAELTSLETLKLSSNLIGFIGSSALVGLSGLRSLELDTNQLTSLPEDIFHELQNLESLSLARNKISSIPEKLFQMNPQLLTLTLTENKISYLHADIFNVTLRLEQLHIEENLLSTLSEVVFSHLFDLKLISLKGNKFVCDCNIAGFRLWSSTARLQWNAEQSGECQSPIELKGRYLLNVEPTDLICTTTTTTTTTTTSTTTTTPLATEKRNTGAGIIEGTTTEGKLEKLTIIIIVVSCVGGSLLIMIVIGVAVCCSKRRKRTKPRQVKYIVKPQNAGQDNTKPKLPEHVGNGVRIPDILASSQMHGDAHTFEGSYRPNIMPTETDLDEDLKHGYDNGMYNGETSKGVYTINAEFNDGLQFYNSLSRSIAGASVGRGMEQPLALSVAQRSTVSSPTQAPPPYISTHRATPVRLEDLAVSQHKGYVDYEPPTVWKDRQSYNSTGALPTGGYYSYDKCFTDNDCNGKFSTGSGDSGVHSNSPLPRVRTPTDFSDHQISPTEYNHSSLNRRISIKNETYV